MTETITKPGPTDLETCARIMASADPWHALGFSYDECLADLAKDYMDVHVVRNRQDEITGFMAVIGYAVAGEPLLEYICIREDMRGQGIGTRLIRYFEETLFPDAANLYLFASDINGRAMRLYQRLGYHQIAELPDYNLKGQTEFFFRKHRRPKR